MLEEDLLPWVEGVGDLGHDILEIGPGPGLTTDLLRQRVRKVTAVEVDPMLGEPLRQRLAGTNVEVVVADATEADLASGRFSAAACFSVLHHMPSADHQDRLFAVLHRAMRSGGVLVGQESLDIDAIRAGHAGDTFNPVDPDTLPSRLTAAGFGPTTTDVVGYHFRFVARKAD